MNLLRLPALALLALTSAAPTQTPAFPSVEHATYHQLLFADADVAVLKNHYPPRSDSGYHLHPRELFYVVIAPGRFGSQRLGADMRYPPLIAAGGTGYNVMTDVPLIHRVVNVEDRAVHIVAIEIRRPTPRGNRLTDRPAQWIQVFDNKRVRAWRLILAPGATVPAMQPATTSVRIAVRGGLLLTRSPGFPAQIIDLKAGDTSIQPGAPSRSLANSGETPIELVELELK